jgi:hypothetical protein
MKQLLAFMSTVQFAVYWRPKKNVCGLNRYALLTELTLKLYLFDDHKYKLKNEAGTCLI